MNCNDFNCSGKRKASGFHLKLSFSCGRWDLNPHGLAVTRSLVLLVCQFRHFRICLATVLQYQMCMEMSSKKFSNKALTLPRVFDIIIKSRKDMRKCRNWQTSKTKDLVAIAVVWVQVPSSALGKMVGNLIFQRFPIFLFVAKLGYSWVTTV